MLSIKYSILVAKKIKNSLLTLKCIYMCIYISHVKYDQFIDMLNKFNSELQYKTRV